MKAHEAISVLDYNVMGDLLNEAVVVGEHGGVLGAVQVNACCTNAYALRVASVLGEGEYKTRYPFPLSFPRTYVADSLEPLSRHVLTWTFLAQAIFVIERCKPSAIKVLLGSGP